MNFKKLISNQLFIILTALFPIIVFGFLTYQNLKIENEQTSINYINRLNTNIQHNIATYLKTIQLNMNDLTHTVSFLEKQIENNILNLQAIQKKHITDYFDTLNEIVLTLSQKNIFQYTYSFTNKRKIVLPQYTIALKNYVKLINTPNVLMINPEGKILYSSDKEELLNRNVQTITPAFKKMWKKITRLKNNKNILYVQISYDKYTKKYEQYAISHFKDVDGYIAVEANMQHIKEDIKNVSSLGPSAETYLVYKENNQTRLVYDRQLKYAHQGDKKSNIYIDKGFHSSGFSTKISSTDTVEIVGYMPVHLKNITYSMQTTVAYIDVISPKIHSQNYFEHFIKRYKYKNIFLIEKDGDIFYTTAKEKDYTGNIFSKIYKKSFFVDAVHEVFQKKHFVLTEIQENPACIDNNISQYALIPIFSTHNVINNIIAIELDENILKNYLLSDTNIYKSAHSYLLSQNNEHNLLTPEIPSNTSNLLIQESTINYSHVHWKIRTQINKDDVSLALETLKFNIYLFFIISVFIATISMYFVTNEKTKNEKKLKHEVMHDNLTNLPNRRYATEFLENVLSNAKRNKTKGAVLFIDLDKFKAINDTYGHKAGDKVLVEIAKRFKSIVRENDLVARIGGDEFLIILHQYQQLHGIEYVCKKLLTVASKEIIDGNNTYKIGLSIGIATFPSDSTLATQLLTYADTAMYATKESGRHNFTYYNHEMMEASLREAKLEQEIENAIKHDELILHYQPQVHLQDLKVIGVEALVRWNHPVRGLVMPHDFIPIAENSKLIVNLGYWVLRHACQDFKNWQELGYTMQYVAVNISTKQLSDNDCITMVLSILDELDFNPMHLELEITETTLITDFEATIKNINTFKEYGIKFSIDDFGTGYSSLSYLKTLHISTLKIDREFIKDILTKRDDRTIVTAIIAMGHALEYNIIAEGAEEKAEIELLKYLACDIVQGYYFSKPLPEEKLLEFIDKGIND